MKRILVLALCCIHAVAEEPRPTDIEEPVSNPTVEQLPQLFLVVRKQTHCFPDGNKSGMRAIVSLGKPSVPYLARQVRAFEGKSWTTQVRYLYPIVKLGPEAKDSLPAVERLIRNEETHKYIRHYALTARAAISRDVEALTQLATKNPDFGAIALEALGDIGQDARSAAPALAELARIKRYRSPRLLPVLEKLDPRLAEEVASELINR